MDELDKIKVKELVGGLKATLNFLEEGKSLLEAIKLGYARET